MKLTREELNRIKCISNFCLIRPDVLGNDSYEISGGIKIYLDNVAHPENAINVWGTIIKNPATLSYKNCTEGTMPWETTIETKEGDHVLYDFVTAAQALGKLYDKSYEYDDNKYLLCGDDLYILMKYSDIFLVKKDEEITMLNGFILIEPVDEEEVKSSLIYMPDFIKKKQSLKYGRVAHKGSLIKSYSTILRLDKEECDNTDVEVGDYVCFDRLSDIEIEFSTHQKLTKKYFRMQRKDFLAIIPEKIIVK